MRAPENMGLPQVAAKEARAEQPTFPCLEPGAPERKPVKSVILDFAAYHAGDQCMVLYFDKGYVYEYGAMPA
jgi:hypothetical protein